MFIILGCSISRGAAHIFPLPHCRDLEIWSPVSSVTKVCGPDVVSPLTCKPLFEWYMARFVEKIRHQKGMCYDESGLCAQNESSIIG